MHVQASAEVCCSEGIQLDLHLLLELTARQIVQRELGAITDMITLITSIGQLVRTYTKEVAKQTVSEMIVVAAK